MSHGCKKLTQVGGGGLGGGGLGEGEVLRSGVKKSRLPTMMSGWLSQLNLPTAATSDWCTAVPTTSLWSAGKAVVTETLLIEAVWCQTRDIGRWPRWARQHESSDEASQVEKLLAAVPASA